MSDAMRIVRAVCALLIVFSCVPLAAGGQPDSAVEGPRNPAFPPAPLPPLYFPRDVHNRVPLTPELIERINHREQSGGRIVRVSQKQPESEFRPISELPPEEKLPAGPMLVAAYVFVVLALFVYVISIARRLNAVGREIARLDAQLKRH
jgi:CcmD family protein